MICQLLAIYLNITITPIRFVIFWFDVTQTVLLWTNTWIKYIRPPLLIRKYHLNWEVMQHNIMTIAQLFAKKPLFGVFLCQCDPQHAEFDWHKGIMHIDDCFKHDEIFSRNCHWKNLGPVFLLFDKSQIQSLRLHDLEKNHITIAIRLFFEGEEYCQAVMSLKMTSSLS